MSVNIKQTNLMELKIMVCQRFGINEHVETFDLIPVFSDVNINTYCKFFTHA